jgi:hypothetical protein
MASQRITKELHTMIVNAAINGAYQSERDEVTAMRKEATEVVYRTFVSEEQEKIMKKMPSGFFNVLDGGHSLYIRNDDGSRGAHRTLLMLHFGTGRRVPAFFPMAHSTLNSTKALIAFEAIEDTSDAINLKVNELRLQVSNTVSSASTMAKLLMIWPESKAFIPPWALSEKHKETLPAVIIDGLNNLLALARPELALAAA